MCFSNNHLFTAFVSHVMAFQFSYIALRVKRTIPPPKILYQRVKAVFDFFKDKIDSQTNKPLFNELARKKADLVLISIRQGYVSDPPGIDFYTRKTDNYGKPMVDRDGLWLFRSFRGTNLLESMHQTLTISIGHTRAGPRYSDNLLALVRHRFSWRASERNRPNFPQVRHYQSWSIDTMNELYEELFGHPKYTQWVPYNDIAASLMPSFGIVPLTASRSSVDDQPVSIDPEVKLTDSLRYLAMRQGTGIPYTPVKTKEEKALFTRLIKEALRHGSSMTAASTFEDMEEAWSTFAKGGSNGIYGKYAEHLALYYKKWRKTQSRRDAVKATMASVLTDALEYTTQTGVRVGVSVPVGIDGAEQDGNIAMTAEEEETVSPTATAATSHGQPAPEASLPLPQLHRTWLPRYPLAQPFLYPWTQPMIPMATPPAHMRMLPVPSDSPLVGRIDRKKRRRKHCQHCADPGCNGGYNREYCTSTD